MDIVDFMPKYPLIEQSQLDPYSAGDGFYSTLFNKKEFREARLSTAAEPFPKEKGVPLKYQQSIARFLSSNTPYNSLLLLHAMGTGKCVDPGTQIFACLEGKVGYHAIGDLWKAFSSAPGSVTVTDETGVGEWIPSCRGLLVNSVDDEFNLISAPVSKLYREMIDTEMDLIELTDGRKIQVTKAHRLFSDKGWINDISREGVVYLCVPKQLVVGSGEARHLVQPDLSLAHAPCADAASQVAPAQVAPAQVVQAEFSYVRVKSVTPVRYRGFVYDLEVDRYHNYVAEGIVTHNTCSAIGAVEQVRSEHSTIRRALVLAPSQNLLANFRNELADKCTPGTYHPEDMESLTARKVLGRTNKKIGEFYEFETFAIMAAKLRAMGDDTIRETYSNYFIIIDEAHDIRTPEGKTGEDVESLEEVEDKENKDFGETVYTQISRLVHGVSNFKLIILTGTPMKDNISEIAAIMNLLLPVSQALPIGNAFVETFFRPTGSDEGSTQPRLEPIPEKIGELKAAFRGRVSFLREIRSSVKVEYLGDLYGDLVYNPVMAEYMSDFQTQGYNRAIAFKSVKVVKGKTKTSKGIYSHSRQASLFVFPDGSWGSDGFKKYVTFNSARKSHALVPELRRQVLTADGVAKFSVAYATTIRKIDATPGNCFVYCSFAKGSGAIVFSLILEAMGYTRVTGDRPETSPGKRYAIITSSLTSKAQVETIRDTFNSPNNRHGEILKVIIGTQTVALGISFYNVLFEAILTPFWNDSETSQAVARGIRLGSHNALIAERKLAGLPYDDLKVEVMRHVSIPKAYGGIQLDSSRPEPTVIPPTDSDEYAELLLANSINLLMYKTSEDKDVNIRRLIRLIVESSFDCGLNYLQNHVTGRDFKRDCDYLSCDYTCDGLTPKDLDVLTIEPEHESKLIDGELDYSTYQLYYASPEISAIRKRIEIFFRDNPRVQIDEIIQSLRAEFSEQDIRNTLHAIADDSSMSSARDLDASDALRVNDLTFANFLNLFTRNPVKIIMTRIEELFRIKSRYTFDEIIQEFPDRQEFEVVLALKKLIQENVSIANRFGFRSYLRESESAYFLVSNVLDTTDRFSDFYNAHPCATRVQPLRAITDKLAKNEVPTLIAKLCGASKAVYEELIVRIPEATQIKLLETCLALAVSKPPGVDTNASFIVNTLKYFEGRYVQIDGVWYITFNNTYRKFVPRVAVSTQLPDSLLDMAGEGDDGGEGDDDDEDKRDDESPQELTAQELADLAAGAEASGDLVKALRFQTELMNLLIRQGELSQAITAGARVAILSLLNGDTEHALGTLDGLFDLNPSDNDLIIQASIKSQPVYIEAGRFDTAITNGLNAIKLMEKTGASTKAIVNILSNTAAAYKKRAKPGDVAKSKQLYTKAVGLLPAGDPLAIKLNGFIKRLG